MPNYSTCQCYDMCANHFLLFVDMLSHLKQMSSEPILFLLRHPNKKHVPSIITAKKGPKRGRKAIIAKNVSHDGTPIKHGLLHLWWQRGCREKSQSLLANKSIGDDARSVVEEVLSLMCLVRNDLFQTIVAFDPIFIGISGWGRHVLDDLIPMDNFAFPVGHSTGCPTF